MKPRLIKYKIPISGQWWGLHDQQGKQFATNAHRLVKVFLARRWPDVKADVEQVSEDDYLRNPSRVAWCEAGQYRQARARDGEHTDRHRTLDEIDQVVKYLEDTDEACERDLTQVELDQLLRRVT